MDHVAQRRERLTQCLSKEGLDALLVSHPLNVTYLSGFTGEASYLVFTRERTILVSDMRFFEQIAEECPGLETHIRPPTQTIYQAASDVLGKLGVTSVGFESNHWTVAEREMLGDLNKTVTFKGAADRVEKLRAVKDTSEIAEIRESIAIAERAFTVFRTLMRPEDREKDLHDAMEMYIRRCGGTGTAFPTIVATGERAALPHAPPTERTVGQSEMILVDWGACGRLYKSDLTRVLVPRKNAPFHHSRTADGNASRAKLAEIYAIVLQAQQKAIAALRPGVKGSEVDAAARGWIADAGYGPQFGHGIGHGFGLQIHEAPFMRPNAEIVLEAGMVVTVEPGIYLSGWGGVRIEDDILVTPDGHEVLTQTPRQLDEMILDW
jgi:Xaa-Pro aminopeptidase